jgi:toxin YoeB
MEKIWDLIFQPKSLEELDFFYKNGNKLLLKKIYRLLEELEIHPETGIGKPEKLRENLSGYWSRRINDKHRIIYTINEENKTVKIYSLRGHYKHK